MEIWHLKLTINHMKGMVSPTQMSLQRSAGTVDWMVGAQVVRRIQSNLSLTACSRSQQSLSCKPQTESLAPPYKEENLCATFSSIRYVADMVVRGMYGAIKV